MSAPPAPLTTEQGLTATYRKQSRWDSTLAEHHLDSMGEITSFLPA